MKFMKDHFKREHIVFLLMISPFFIALLIAIIIEVINFIRHLFGG